MASTLFELSEKFLPDSLRDLVPLIGLSAVEKLADKYGGTQLYVPAIKRLNEDHPISKLIGLEAARKLAGPVGLKIKIASARQALITARNHQIAQKRFVGKASIKALAIEYKLDERQISKILSETRL